jgi:hypothetical protein
MEKEPLTAATIFQRSVATQNVWALYEACFITTQKISKHKRIPKRIHTHVIN